MWPVKASQFTPDSQLQVTPGQPGGGMVRRTSAISMRVGLNVGITTLRCAHCIRGDGRRRRRLNFRL